MGYNNLSGTVLLPNELIRVDGATTGIVSGNLSTSDGADVINVPRVSNATNNAIVTNVGGNANTLTCESNLTFDGSTLDLTGDLTASIGVSASVFFGDGSQLTGITGGGGGNANAQGPLGALQFRDNAEAGTISGSDFLVFNNRILNINGGFSLGHRTITSATTASTSDYYIGVDTTNSQVDIRLLGATSMQTGQTIVFKDEAGNAGTNNVVIFASGSDTIDGQNSVVLESPFAAISLYCNGSSKYFIT